MTIAYQMPFGFVPLPEIQRALHELDRANVARELLMTLGNESAVAEYRVRQLIEEAISSSVLEGARPTTREVARQMMREAREPTSLDERMIYNNWRAMRRILELRDGGRPLTVDDLLELHRILGEGALEVPDAAGRFREPHHEVQVADIEGTVWHVPPPAEGLRERIEALLRFVEDGSTDGGAFVHPVLRAIIAHFWLGYEHPFRDGNGRMARALYYWTMLRHGYEMAEFLSISGPIDLRPKAYYLAFAYTETDGGDLTYFILHQLRVMHEAMDELTSHLSNRAERMKELARAVAGFDELNHRQRALLQHAVRHPLESYTVEGHAASHHVHYQTARTDLVELVKRGYFEDRRVGKGKRFFPAKSFTDKIQSS
jgi:Fic family protein